MPYRDALPTGDGVRNGPLQRLALGLVWLGVASGAVVFSEPAPVDILTMGLIAGLPLVGLVWVRAPLLAVFAVWLACGAGAFIASAQSGELDRSTTHAAISIYLYLAFLVFAAFVAKRPAAHTKLILDAYLAAAFVAAVAGVIGYFNLLPGSAENFTRFSRASGTFKDPNVYGPFLVPAMLYALHQVLNARFSRTVLPAIMLLFLSFAILLSFSRGAWFNAAVGIAVYAYFSIVRASTNRHRLKVLLLGTCVVAAAVLVLFVASRYEAVGDLLSQRAALTQSYDVGPQGRFGGQAKAQMLILDNPLGIGALQFGAVHHHEDVHNVYLSMFLNAGWLGGLTFAILVLVTGVFGLRHALRRSETSAYFLIAYAAFLGNALEGFVIDIDHWRHFYLLMAIVWGLMVADRAPAQSVTNRRSARMSSAGARLIPA